MIAFFNKKYFIYSIFLSCIFFLTSPIFAEEVCFSREEVIDVITLLDASERDIEGLSTCSVLVDQLYSELEKKDKKIVNLTQELIDARQDVLEYRAENKRLKKITWYAVGASAVIILIEVLPLL